MRPAHLAAILAAVLVLGAAILAAPAAAHAQAGPTASKNLDINIFGGAAVQSPDYGPYRNTGGAFGANITRYFYHFPIPVGAFLEGRGTFASGSVINENSFVGGLGLKTEFKKRYHPYIDYEVGRGKIVFAVDPYPGYHEDHALATSYGGGIDIDVYRNFALKFDAQRQYMDFGTNSIKITPVNFVIGINYTIPFRALNRNK